MGTKVHVILIFSNRKSADVHWIYMYLFTFIFMHKIWLLVCMEDTFFTFIFILIKFFGIDVYVPVHFIQKYFLQLHNQLKIIYKILWYKRLYFNVILCYILEYGIWYGIHLYM